MKTDITVHPYAKSIKSTRKMDQRIARREKKRRCVWEPTHPSQLIFFSQRHSLCRKTWRVFAQTYSLPSGTSYLFNGTEVPDKNLLPTGIAVVSMGGDFDLMDGVGVIFSQCGGRTHRWRLSVTKGGLRSCSLQSVTAHSCNK